MPQGREWSGRIEHRSGAFREHTANSLRELIRQLPSFADRQRSSDIRVKAAKGTIFYFEDDFLELLELNKGAQGLDLSECSLGSMDLSRDRIQDLRQSFYQQYRYDPSWWTPSTTRGLDLSRLLATNTDFSHAKLQGTDFSSAILDDSTWSQTDLTGVLFHDASLNNCWFEGADMRGASLSSAKLKKANFSGLAGPAKLEGVYILRAQLTGASFDWASFQGVVGIGDKTDLQGVRFWGTNLSGVSFEGLDPGSLRGAVFYLATLDRTPLRRDLIDGPIGEELIADRLLAKEAARGSLEAETSPAEWLLRASDSYRSLKANFATLGHTEDTSWAHYQQRLALGRHYRVKWSHEKDRSAISHIVKDRLYWFTAGYGERPGRPLANALLVILIFSLLYYILGTWTGDSFSVAESFVYSAGSFFTVGFADLEATCWITQLLTLVESAAGVILLGLFLWTIGNSAGRF